jgi:transcription elongation factor
VLIYWKCIRRDWRKQQEYCNAGIGNIIFLMNSGEGRSNDRPASANGESRTRIASPAAFPPGFVWGVSTSAHQVEGNNSNNQWAAWENAGRIKSRDRVELACDWWRNAEQDLERRLAFAFRAGGTRHCNPGAQNPP